MPVPGVDRAVVEPRKVRDYLLSPAHPVGRFKAAFFVSLGYTPETWSVLSADLREHAASGEAHLAEASPFGQKYEVRGALKGPAGKEAEVVTVWIILSGEDFPRFVTAFPGARP